VDLSACGSGFVAGVTAALKLPGRGPASSPPGRRGGGIHAGGMCVEPLLLRLRSPKDSAPPTFSSRRNARSFGVR